jgi:hypothetical protein
MTSECQHLKETTSRYDKARKLLTFLLVCPVCDVQHVVETVPYEPRVQLSRSRS